MPFNIALLTSPSVNVPISFSFSQMKHICKFDSDRFLIANLIFEFLLITLFKKCFFNFLDLLVKYNFYLYFLFV